MSNVKVVCFVETHLGDILVIKMKPKAPYCYYKKIFDKGKILEIFNKN